MTNKELLALIQTTVEELLAEAQADLETPEGFEEGVEALQAALVSRLPPE